jgi:hypothetical protein
LVDAFFLIFPLVEFFPAFSLFLPEEFILWLPPPSPKLINDGSGLTERKLDLMRESLTSSSAS